MAEIERVRPSERFSNLDAELRVSTRAQINNLHHELGTTTIYVTHDQIEATTLADRVVVVSKGEVQQVGTPLEIYDRPANTFVAGFIGNPAMNLIPGELRAGTFHAANAAIPGFSGMPDGPVTLGFRAEDAQVAETGEIRAPLAARVPTRLCHLFDARSGARIDRPPGGRGAEP